MKIKKLMRRIEEERKLAFYDGDANMLDFMADISIAMTKLVAVAVSVNALRDRRHDETAEDVLSEALWGAEYLIDGDDDEDDDDEAQP